MRGRIRTVKPELFTDERLWDLGVETGLPVLQAFIGLWCFADREGRFEWRPRALRAMILPFWEGDMASVLEALASRSFITRYVVDGSEFGHIRTFSAHQVIPHREAQSTLPDPALHGRSSEPGHCTGTAVQLPGSAPGEGKGREGNGRGREGRGNSRASTDATLLHREAGQTRPGRVYTMPCEAPPPEYLDDAVMAGVSREQAAATWTHYWTVGLPERGVEKLYPFLVKSAKERANATTKVPGARRSRSEPDDRLQAQLERVEMLRAQEAEEARRAAGGGT